MIRWLTARRRYGVKGVLAWQRRQASTVFLGLESLLEDAVPPVVVILLGLDLHGGGTHTDRHAAVLGVEEVGRLDHDYVLEAQPAHLYFELGRYAERDLRRKR